MNAQQAKELAKKSNLEKFNSGLNSISKQIETAALEGKYFINITLLNEDVKKHLIGMGYQIEYVPGDFREQRDAGYFKIQW